MSNFGFMRMRLVDAYEVAYHEAKSAVNASDVLLHSEQFPTVADAVSDCALVIGTASLGHRALQHSLRRLEYGAEQIRQAAERESVALLFGSEKFGLSNEDMSHCHWLMHIPTREEHQSMNLGQAVAVCLYELIRSEEARMHEPATVRGAAAAEVERVSEMLMRALRESGYVQTLTAESTERKVRRMVRRLALSERDAQLWAGMLRQILWKLGKT